MDYEKAYKDALERAREWYNKGNALIYADRGMCEIFPELKESGDDKIRKALVEIFSLVKENKKPVISKEDAELILTWLEKHKHTQKDVDDAYLKGVTDAKNELEKQGELPEAKETLYTAEVDSDDEKMITALLEGFKYHQLFNPMFGGVPDTEIIAWLEKKRDINKENDEDYGIDGLWHAQHILEKTLGAVDGYETDDGILEHKCAISAIKKLREQKSAKIGEPYPETLDKAVDLYYFTYGNGKGGFDYLSLDKFRDIVKTFVEDYGQKLAWGEEDDKQLDIAMESCQFLNKIETVDWLKLLKDRLS